MEIAIFSPIDRLLWGVAITVILFGAIYYYLQGRKKQLRGEKLILYGFALYFFCYAIVRILFFLSDFTYIGRYVDHTFYRATDAVNSFFPLLVQWGYFFSILGLTFLFYSYEYTVKKSKFIITGLSVVFLLITVITPFDLSRSLIYAYSFIASLLIIFVIYSFTRRSDSEFQPVATFILIGFIIAMLGHTLDASVIKEQNIIPLFLPPILIIIGSLLYISPSFINLDKLKNTNLYRLGFLIIIGISLLVTTFIIVSLEFSDILSTIVIIGNIIFSIILIFLIRRAITSIDSEGINTKIDGNMDILGIFTKPKKLTEEEVSISKEKKICLVCKSQISGHTFVCVDCGTFYCNKCYTALTGLENACWACDTALDGTKPVQKAKEEEKEVEIEQDQQHKEIKKGKEKE